MEVKLINNISELEKISESWVRIQEGASIYSSYDYFYEQVKTMNHRVMVFYIEESGSIVAIAPFVIIQKKILFRKIDTLSFLPNCDYHDILFDSNIQKQDKYLKAIFTHVEESNCDQIELTHILKGGNLLPYLLKTPQLKENTSFFELNPIIHCSDYKDFQAFKSTHFRKKISQYLNKIKREHQAEVKKYVNNDSNIFESIKKLHLLRNEGPKRRSLFNHPERSKFILNLFNNPKVENVTYTLENEKGIIAYITAYHNGHYLHNWNMAHHPDFEKYSPGDLIYYVMIEDNIENKALKIDFGSGSYSWKFSMTESFIPIFIYSQAKKHHFLIKFYSILKLLYKNI